MKKGQKMPKKSHGAYVATAVKSLKKSGLSGEALEIALSAIRGEHSVKLIRLPRHVSRSICKMISIYKRIVVVNKGPKKFKVFSLDSYLNMKSQSSLNATKHKPWEYSKGTKSKIKTSQNIVDLNQVEAVAS